MSSRFHRHFVDNRQTFWIINECERRPPTSMNNEYVECFCFIFSFFYLPGIIFIVAFSLFSFWVFLEKWCKHIFDEHMFERLHRDLKMKNHHTHLLLILLSLLSFDEMFIWWFWFYCWIIISSMEVFYTWKMKFQVFYRIWSHFTSENI